MDLHINSPDSRRTNVEGTQTTPHELDAGGSRTPPPRSLGDLTPPEVIASAAARFKKRRCFQSLAVEVPASPSSVTDVVTEATAAQPSHRGEGVQDSFSPLSLDRAPFTFPDLNEEEKRLMEAVVGGRSSLGQSGLEMVQQLERVLTIPSDINQMSNESYHCHLASTAQMAYNMFMMCAHSKRRWAAEERQVMDVMTSRHRVDQTTHHRLREEKNVLETKLRDVKASNASLMGEMQEAHNRLVSSEQRLQEVLIEVSASRQTIAEMRASEDALRLELQAVKEELKSSQAKLEGLKTSSGDLKDFFRGSAALDEVVGDKIFLSMSNLYFFNRSRGMQVDFSAAFHPVTVPDFDDVFPARASAANRGEYLDAEPGFDVI